MLGGMILVVSGLLMVVSGQVISCFVSIERNTRATYEVMHELAAKTPEAGAV